MAKASTAKTVTEEVVETVTEEVIETVETTVEATEKTNENKKKEKKESIKVEPLQDSDEIEVVSLVPNVSYKDNRTYDVYKWEEVGHSEYMTVETLNNMWRNNKGYFKKMFLKPKDERVIKKFGLEKTYKEYEYLMDASNYTKKNIKDVCSAISNTPNGLKMSICDKVKHLVINEEITDVSVIRALEKHLKIDLIDFLD